MHTHHISKICVHKRIQMLAWCVCIRKLKHGVCASENAGTSMVFVHQRTMVLVCASENSGIRKVCVDQRI